MTKALTITDVLLQLDEIIALCKQRQSRIGYFAVLYKRMTLAVQQGILNNSFEDGKRMEQLDVNFANRYIQAWEAYTTKQPCSDAWCFVFDACETKNKVVLQHLMLGINTHINLDLAIAAVETSPGDKIHGLKNDFEKINELIAALSQSIQDSLTKIWWPLKFISRITNKREEAVLNFSINTARKASWANALTLSLVQAQAHDDYIKVMDNGVVAIAKRILNPGLWPTIILKPVVWMESKSISKLIEVLEK